MITLITSLADSILAGGDPINLPQAKPDQVAIQIILNLVIGIIAAVSVLVITIAGMRFITSRGDSGKVANARNTILYAITGLVISIIAAWVVNFVIDFKG